jgi:putative heme-binding domain-containing protein
LVFLGLWTIPAAAAENVQLGLRVPAGFEVTEYAGSDLANDIYCMTLDPAGRVAVSGRGYIRVLVSDARGEKAERAVEVAAAPKDGAMGLLWEDEWLYFTGDGGLRRYRIKKGEARAAGPSELIRRLKTGGEHDAHAIRRGPDGWLYVLCGNMTKIDRDYATLPTSPIKNPVAGCVLRFAPDLKQSEIIADGFRNPYGMDFNADGELFTFDSDNERCVSLPWYESIRLYHVLPGGHYGWQAPQRGQFWRMPPYFPDVVAPVATFGRGSPTGVVCYRATQFPKKYQGGIFLLDWTFGRVYFVALKRSGSTYSCEKEVFLEAVGENGFAPTAVAVHPGTGDMFISIGGRGTRGAVYRIRYAIPRSALTQQGSAPLRPSMKPRDLDWRPELAGQLLEQATGKDLLTRRNALASLVRHAPHLKKEVILEAVRANLDHPDRYVRMGCADLVARVASDDWQALLKTSSTARRQMILALGKPQLASGQVSSAARAVTDETNDRETRLSGVRLLQIALGDLMSLRKQGTVWEGYSSRCGPIAGELRSAILAALRPSFPSRQPDLDRELARTLAVLEDDDPATLTKVIDRVSAQSDPVDDFHYLIVLACLKGKRSEAITAKTAAALLDLDRKLAARHYHRDRHWPLRLTEAYEELVRKDPGLRQAILQRPVFGRPAHALFANVAGFDRRRAAEVFLARARKTADYEWTPELIEIVAALPDNEAFPVCRRLWEHGGLDEAIIKVLARKPQPEDREKLLSGLDLSQTAIQHSCLEALAKLPPRNDGPTALALVQALRRLSDSKDEKRLAGQLAHYLQKLTGQTALGTKKEPWIEWFRKSYPSLAGRLGGEEHVDVPAWDRRLAMLDWARGDAERGHKIFIKTSCAACHSGGQALGPDLRGVTGRFSRRDLFTAILLPSKDVSPRYRTTQVTTADGKTYRGIVIYEAVDSLILQTGAATSIRLINKQITERRVTPTSLMPSGLIDKLTDMEIIDLYAYLKSLGAVRPAAGPKK